MEQAPHDPDRRCKHCGTALSDETTAGLCPRCLLEMNFASRTMPGGDPSPQIPPPSPEEMADKFPQFEILECLGRGGMGIVYKARQKSLDRLVAIKVLADGRHDEAEFAARFSREARTLAKMSHPNIVTVFDHGESDGLFYIVMEYVDGVNLRDLLREGKIEPEQALAIVPPICEALEYAHDHGVVHRDIKPENILIDRDGRVKIADFGIAALIGADADHSGTPPYMAPEQQASGGTIDRRADIYALGAVLYEMLTGERPDKDLVAPSKRVEIDVRLDEIVLRALEKEPARRYQTAGEFRTVVETMATRPGTEASARVRREPTDPTVKSVMAVLFAIALGLALMGFNTMPWPMNGSETLLFVVILLAGVGVTVYVFRPFWKQAFGNASQGQGGAPQTARGAAVDWRSRGVDRRSKRTLFGLPLWHVASGIDPETGRPRTARGIIAIGDRAQGVVAIGGVAMGGFAFGGVSIGLVSWGGVAVGLFAMGGVGIALLAAFAAFAIAPVALGGMACGWYAYGGQGLGVHLASADARDPEGVRFFGSWAMPLVIRLSILNVLLIIPVFMLFSAGLPYWLKLRERASQSPKGKGGSSVAAAAAMTVLSLVLALVVAVSIALVNQLPEIDSRLRKAQATSYEPERVDDRSPQEVARDLMEASYAGEVERALSMIGGPLGQTPKEHAWMIETFQATGEEGTGPVEFGEWHEAGIYAVTSYVPPGGRSPVEFLLILERIRGTWRAVGTGIRRPGVSLEDELRAFKTFRSVNREDRDEVAAAFVRAVKTGDFAQAAMMVWRPMPMIPSQLAREFSKANRGAPEADLTVPLSWYQEGPYAVTWVAFTADQPELLSYLVLRQTEGIWRIVWSDGIDPDATLADAMQRFEQEQMVASIMVEDLALRYLVAVREKDVKTLRELSVDRNEGWTEALVGHFAMELRERFHQLTGEEFTMYPHPSKVRVRKDLAVVTCHAFRETQKKLNGNVLVLHFTRTGEGWKVWTARNAPESQEIEEHLEQARQWAAEWEKSSPGAAVNVEESMIPAEETFDSVTTVKALPLIPPAAMPKDSPLTVEQVKNVLEGVTWSEFIEAFADEGRGNEISWKQVESKGEEHHRFEIGFSFGGEKMLLDLAVDPEFQHAVPSRLRPARNPGQVKAEASEFMPVMVMRYALKSGHPAAAPALEKAEGRARQFEDLNTMRQYILALVMYHDESGSLPQSLELLADKHLRELTLITNHATGNKEKPLYHGSPDLQVEKLDSSKFILLAAPSAGPDGRRAVGFLDGHFELVDEADYQAKLARQ